MFSPQGSGRHGSPVSTRVAIRLLPRRFPSTPTAVLGGENGRGRGLHKTAVVRHIPCFGKQPKVCDLVPLRRARRGGALGVGDADGAAVDGVTAGGVVPPRLASAHGRAATGHLKVAKQLE